MGEDKVEELMKIREVLLGMRENEKEKVRRKLMEIKIMLAMAFAIVPNYRHFLI